MLIPVDRVLRRQAPSRAEELVALGTRFRAARAFEAPRAGEAQRALAIEIRALKVKLSAALGAASACRTCVTWAPRSSAFSGGACCSGVTEDLFSDDEVAALVLAGTGPRHLRAPRGEHSGCAFRAATGCTLSPADRPQRCVHYTCDLLQRELHARGELESIEILLDDLHRRMRRFVALRSARLEDEMFAGLEDALQAAIAPSRPPSAR